RNLAEQLQWQTEKFLAESGDKLPGDTRDEINEALGELRSALGGSDLEKVKAAQEKLATASQKAGTMLYQQNAQPTGGEQPGAAGAGASAGATGGPASAGAEDVVDAEIVDEDDKK